MKLKFYKGLKTSVNTRFSSGIKIFLFNYKSLIQILICEFSPLLNQTKTNFEKPECFSMKIEIF